MLTDKQEETIKKLKTGELTASEKADFYYRLSGILKKDLGNIKDLSRLLDEIPAGNLRKIDLMEATTAAMELIEKLVKKLNPPQVRQKFRANRIVGLVAVKSFSIESFDEKSEIKSVGYSVFRDLTVAEKTLVYNIVWHIDNLGQLITPHRIALECAYGDFLTKDLPALIEDAKSKSELYQVTVDNLDLDTPHPLNEIMNAVGMEKRAA